ncbi:uncharacterized protein LOC120191128 [Hibiscus syriacus]|uniref:uncharacterized protein LOC120191128 n=1 Tax=Hibiscus syriacus TaxID=106335 RepID=UPI00192333CF|nr:uncharacterized protein LOC120191128 [Hibiscus syriacus]
MSFNIVVVALSGLINKTVEERLFNGVRVGSSSLRISHIQFADDLIIFSEADEEQVKNIKRILKVFKLASGLRLNLRKSKLYRINVEDGCVTAWAEGLKCDWDRLLSVYLGLPLGQARNFVKLRQPIIDKVQSRLDGWKSKFLSFGGRITLIKSILAFIGVLSLDVPNDTCCVLQAK